MRASSIAFANGSGSGRLAPAALAGSACAALCAALPVAAQSDRCLESRCFSDQQIREFRVVDEDTLIVFTGRDRCAFMVTVDGLMCSLTYLPEVEFFRARDREIEVRRRTRDPRDTAIRDPSDDGFARNDRICTNNATLFALESFGLAATDSDTMPQGIAACQVREVASITDNDLVEILANEQIAPPPPPVGNGEISRRNSEPAPEDEP